MKPYLISLAAGLLVGVVYSLLNVRSPAPPMIALVGLLGILMGEQLWPLLRSALDPDTKAVAWIKQECAPHLFGRLPVGPESRLACTRQADTPEHGEG